MEGLLDAIKAYILANIQSFLAALSTTEIPLADLEDKDIIIGDCDITSVQYPVVLFLNPGPGTFGEMTGMNGAGERELELDFAFFVRGDTGGALYRKALRYSAALEALLRADLTLGNTGGLSELTLKDFSYLDGVEGNTKQKGFVITASVQF